MNFCFLCWFCILCLCVHIIMLKINFCKQKSRIHSVDLYKSTKKKLNSMEQHCIVQFSFNPTITFHIPNFCVDSMQITNKKISFVTLNISFASLGGVSSVPFPFRFPFQLHCELVSSLLALDATEFVSQPLTQTVVEMINIHVISVQQKR